MTEYKVRFARVVIAEEFFEAEDIDAADDEAWRMERDGELSVTSCRDGLVILKDNVVEIQDCKYTWGVEEVGGEPEPVSTTAFAVIKEGE